MLPCSISVTAMAADNAEPSGWFAVTNALVTYAALTGSSEHRVVAERALGLVSVLVERAPRAVGWGLVAASALQAGPLEVAVVVDSGATGADSRAGRELIDTAFASTAPGTVVAWGTGDGDAPLLRDRPLIDGRPSAYVCRGFVCDKPVTEAEDLASMVHARSAVG
jgi:uncharacterized protein YyaL (SSP411 family)